MGHLMTIGELSQRTGVSVKVLRRYDDQGLIYSAGRSPANYRLYDDSALWCVGVVTGLRNLGLTVREIIDLASVYLETPQEPIGPLVEERLCAVKARIESRVEELTALRQRISDFEATHQAELAGEGAIDLGDDDPRRSTA